MMLFTAEALIVVKDSEWVTVAVKIQNPFVLWKKKIAKQPEKKYFV